MLSHGLISAALFLSVGFLYDRVNSRIIKSYGGLINIVPKFSFILMIFVLAALGLPGTTGFIGEFLVLIGIFKINFFLVKLLLALALYYQQHICFGYTKE